MRRKIFLSMLMIALVAALVGGATFAYYTDQEVNNDNTFAAGTLDIVLTDQNNQTFSGPIFNFENIAPGWNVDKAIKKSLRIKSIGTIDPKFKIEIEELLSATDPRYTNAGNALYDAIMVDYEIDGLVRKTASLRTFVADLELYAANYGEFPLPQPPAHIPENRTLFVDATPYLPLTAGNDSQGGEVVLNMTVTATQKTNPGWSESGN